ncbi:hypothetical protein AAVH_07225 [Aphelenchoides avenae]|nr:hypothetical protein AAVH_07225 [Aphelenchus avenae]
MVLKLSDELEQLKKRDGDDHPDRPQVDGQQPRSTLELQKDIPAQNEELAACKAEKGRLEGTLEYLRNSLRLADEQRKSNEGKADVLQKELEELKDKLHASEERWNANVNELERLQKQLEELKEENARLRTWPE